MAAYSPVWRLKLWLLTKKKVEKCRFIIQTTENLQSPVAQERIYNHASFPAGKSYLVSLIILEIERLASAPVIKDANFSDTKWSSQTLFFTCTSKLDTDRAGKTWFFWCTFAICSMRRSIAWMLFVGCGDEASEASSLSWEETLIPHGDDENSPHKIKNT